MLAKVRAAVVKVNAGLRGVTGRRDARHPMCHAQIVSAAMVKRAERVMSCTECGGPIFAGEKYSRSTCKQRGQFHVLVVCKPCNNAIVRAKWLERLKRLLP